ncbi:hypothetical protein HIM_09753 [Hirsutella minnesotensis 3608]|uniref:Uncharacterized protein n=1 Tax=Hirsutella minnesotensis 3608 TaxID=1043627 RepID=A0A0F8A2X5_9HYPO|nr:hypothetical protein HIM_09753 [Hirsutella minnesotensis 3608]
MLAPPRSPVLAVEPAHLGDMDRGLSSLQNNTMPLEPAPTLDKRAGKTFYFTPLENLLHSVVEYVPGFGTIYELIRLDEAESKGDTRNMWISFANACEAAVRDAVLLAGTEEVGTVVMLHTMAESMTDSALDVFLAHPSKPMKVNITKKEMYKEDRHYMLWPGKKDQKEPTPIDAINELDRMKGAHYAGATFQGKLTHYKYAPNGVWVRFNMPHGIYDGAGVTFAWKWETNDNGEHNVPEATHGTIKLDRDNGFGLRTRKGQGGWVGYDFWGKFKSKDHIEGWLGFDGQPIEIDFRRQKKGRVDKCRAFSHSRS